VLRFPQATAVGPDRSVYVADQYTHAIQIFGSDGAFRGEVGSTARGGSGLTAVGAVAVAADGSVYAADGTDQIFRFAADGRLLGSWGGTGSGPGEFRFGAGGGNASGAGGGLAVADGMVYVADTRNDRIQRFAADGSRPVVIVRPARLSRPQGIAVRGSRLIVADDVHHRLAVFDTGGRFIRTVGSGPGPQPRQLRNPYDVAVDAHGRLYVADNSNHRVVRYGPGPGYRYQARWGSFGSGAGQLQYPRGIAVDAGGTSYVADPGNNRVDVFEIGGAPLRSLGASGRNAASSSRRWATGPMRAAHARSPTRSSAACSCSTPTARWRPSSARRHPARRSCPPARTHGILAARGLPLRVRCDLPCRVSITATLATRSRKGGARVALRLRARSLAAGRTQVLRPVLSARDARRLRRALHAAAACSPPSA